MLFNSRGSTRERCLQGIVEFFFRGNGRRSDRTANGGFKGQRGLHRTLFGAHTSPPCAIRAEFLGDFRAPRGFRLASYRPRRRNRRRRTRAGSGRHHQRMLLREAFLAETTHFGAILIDCATLLTGLYHRSFCAADGFPRVGPRRFYSAVAQHSWQPCERCCQSNNNRGELALGIARAS